MPNQNVPYREKSIVFTGFMGVGKTTVGKLLANKLYRSFIDIDEEIEREFNMPITEIFDTIGEKAFREKEKSLIEHFSTQKLKVISVGGGAFLQEETRAICLSNCIVFALDISWDAWKERLDKIKVDRPLLQNLSIEETKELFYKRKEIYSSHNSILTIDDLESEAAADFIYESLKLAWNLYEPTSK